MSRFSSSGSSPVRVSAASGAVAFLAVVVCVGRLLPGAEVETLRLGVVSIDSPRVLYRRFQPLVDHLTRQTGLRFELRLRPSHDDMIEDLCVSRVAFAYLGPFGYLRAREKCGAAPLMRLASGGRPGYRSYILVRSDSRFSSLSELRGTRFGFGDPLSTSAHLLPRALLNGVGIDAELDLSCRYYDRHDLAARAVLLGEVDACAVRDTVAERFLERGLRTLARSQAIAGFPIVAAPSTAEPLRTRVALALGAYPGAPEREGGAADAEPLGSFVPAEDGDYDEVRHLAERVFGPKAMAWPASRLRCGERPR
jgi:phosphonate transport system substrate-binding protein